jgi:hypothetical protein
VKFNLHRSPGSFEIKKMGASETDGERKQPKLKIKLVAPGDPSFLDDYLDGHNSGAQPSSVFWRTYDGKPEKFIRYGALGRCELIPPSDTCRYVLKITTKPAEGTPQDDDDYHGYREFLVPKAKLCAGSFEVIAHTCMVTAEFEFTCLHEYENVLTSLRLEHAVLISVWNENGELFDQANNPNGADEQETAGTKAYEEGRTLTTGDGEEVKLRSAREIDDEMLARREEEMEAGAEATGIGSDLE